MYKSLGFAFIALTFAYYSAISSSLFSNKTNSKMALSSVSRNVARKVLAVETPEGAGALVRRSIGSMSLRNLTPFLMLDHFHVAEGAVRGSLVTSLCFKTDSFVGFPGSSPQGASYCHIYAGRGFKA